MNNFKMLYFKEFLNIIIINPLVRNSVEKED